MPFDSNYDKHQFFHHLLLCIARSFSCYLLTCLFRVHISGFLPLSHFQKNNTKIVHRNFSKCGLALLVEIMIDRDKQKERKTTRTNIHMGYYELCVYILFACSTICTLPLHLPGDTSIYRTIVLLFYSVLAIYRIQINIKQLYILFNIHTLSLTLLRTDLQSNRSSNC